MTVSRFMVRRQSNGRFCVWDYDTERPAAHKAASCDALSFDLALELAQLLNDRETAATVEIVIAEVDRP
jgi:hypothetical protein